MSVNKVNSDGSLLRVAGGTLYADAPIGEIHAFGGSVIPSGYLLCDGTAYSRTTYAELFAVIGTAFGSGDGSTTFNVPDLREATTKGVGLSGKTSNHYDSDGVVLGEFVEDRIQVHTHNVLCEFGAAGDSRYIPGDTYSQVGGVNSISRVPVNAINNDSARHGDTTEVKAVGVNYIIKAKQVAVPLDIVSALKWKLITNGVVAVSTFSIPSDYTEIFAESTNSFGTTTSAYYYPVIENGTRQKNGVNGEDYCEVDGTNRTVTVHSANAYCRVYGR